MLKTALDANELYQLHLEQFKVQHNLHPECFSQVTLQFGRALGFGEINVNLIAGSYSGQLDYHTETINLLARVEKFTKKLNSDFLITHDFMEELEKETIGKKESLKDLFIRYLGAYDFDAADKKVKLYQAGYRHVIEDKLSSSEPFELAIKLFDEGLYEDSLLKLTEHLLIYPLDNTAEAIRNMCKTRMLKN